MTYLLHFHPDAEKDYIEAYDWYGQKKQELADRFEDFVEERLSKILANPEVYGFSKGNYREAKINIFPLYNCLQSK